jgi:predicted RNase H-like nuclease
MAGPGSFVGPGGRSALPYQILAGVEPVTGGWLVAPGNIQGINLAPQPAFVLPSLAEVLDYRPSFTIVALHAPVGLPEPGLGRDCDEQSRARLGRRARAVVAAPRRELLGAGTYAEAKAIDPGLDIVGWRSLAQVAEVTREVQSWRQRTVWEVHPELAFTSMNDGVPLEYGRRSEHGRKTRRDLLVSKLPGAERVLAERPRGVREQKLLDSLADLWTARRILARAITRMAPQAVWNDDGVRMDIVT